MEEEVRQILLRVKGLCFQLRMTMAVAESCTGGLLSCWLTALPGSSHFFLCGVTCYSNKAKERFVGVPSGVIQEEGAVSEATAIELARRIRDLSGSDIGIGVTGVAGPSPVTTAGLDVPISLDRPVGLVFVALSHGKGESCETFRFHGGREEIRQRAALGALRLLTSLLLEMKDG